LLPGLVKEAIRGVVASRVSLRRKPLAELGRETVVEDLAKIIFADLIQSESRYVYLYIDGCMFVYIICIYICIHIYHIYIYWRSWAERRWPDGQVSICGPHTERVQVYTDLLIYLYMYMKYIRRRSWAERRLWKMWARFYLRTSSRTNLGMYISI